LGKFTIKYVRNKLKESLNHRQHCLKVCGGRKVENPVSFPWKKEVIDKPASLIPRKILRQIITQTFC